MQPQPRASGSAEQGSLAMWFGVLGGGIAWSVHLLASYLLSEAVCVGNAAGFELWGVSGALLLLIGITVVTAIAAAAATLVSFRQRSHWRRREQHEPAEYLTLTGGLLSGTFLFIILIQSLPLFILRGCG